MFLHVPAILTVNGLFLTKPLSMQASIFDACPKPGMDNLGGLCLEGHLA